MLHQLSFTMFILLALLAILGVTITEAAYIDLVHKSILHRNHKFDKTFRSRVLSSATGNTKEWEVINYVP